MTSTAEPARTNLIPGDDAWPHGLDALGDAPEALHVMGDASLLAEHGLVD
ncbi:MAG: hypothetical protein IKG21_10365 [Atopobiaceae bacterium]|nr:hypothetical protein [Atopobiaceae bacterium]